jgi:hypothetical protein
MINTTKVINGKHIAVLSQTISAVTAVNPLVAFYDMHYVTFFLEFLFYLNRYEFHDSLSFVSVS